MTLRLLIAEDAADVAEVVTFAVRMNWPMCEITVATNGEEALHAFETAPADLVILDVSMPPPDGLEVCRRLRATSDVPILMLTVRSSTFDKIRGLEFGADDYLAKPFDPLELVARLKALLRRSQGVLSPTGPTFTVGDLTLDPATREVRVGKAVIRLTSTEYRLLEELVRHAGSVPSHAYLLEQVWGEEYVHDKHYLKVFIQKLRQKLGDDAENPAYIQTEWGIGYRFVT